MCLICIEFDKSAMSFQEARRALGEMRGAMTKEHIDEVEAKLAEAESEAKGQASSRP